MYRGPSATVPTTSVEITSLSATTASGPNPFGLNTGTVYVNFVIALPATRTLVSVVDTDAFNLDITDQFTSSIVNVDNAWSGTDPYTVWTMTNATPYSPRHRFNVTFS
jgi:hypothetical protein